jgi:hypothetical protein
VDAPHRRHRGGALRGHATRIFLGETILATAAPLPAAGYPFLVLTFAGWVWTLLRAAPSAERLVERRRAADVSA